MTLRPPKYPYIPHYLLLNSSIEPLAERSVDSLLRERKMRGNKSAIQLRFGQHGTRVVPNPDELNAFVNFKTYDEQNCPGNNYKFPQHIE